MKMMGFQHHLTFIEKKREATMSSVRMLACGVVGITLLMFDPLPAAHAKPKQSTSFGCTMNDLQSSFAGSCIGQAEQDIMNGNSYIHVVVCEGNQQKCCTVSGSGQILNCRRPAGSAAMKQPLQQMTPMTPIKPAPGSVQNRGIETTEDLGEESDIPSWLTSE